MAAANFADIFEDVLVPVIFRPWAEELLDRFPVSPSERVLDIGCGTGIVARLIRERNGSAADIQGVDLSPLMVEKARQIAPDIEWHQAGADALPLPDGAFDVIVCQQAFQFFPDRAAALREMRRVLIDGGRVAIATWRPIEEAPLFAGLEAAAHTLFGPRPDRRYSFGDGRAIVELLEVAGFRDVAATVITRTERVPDARTFVRLNLAATYPPINEMGDRERESALDDMMNEARETLDRHADGKGLVHPTRSNLVTARA